MAAKIFSASTLQQKASRSISSLGGSFIVSYGGNMTFAEKTVISATIGGTAEALGGGKFANGAVTGAYVMMLNHLHNEKARNELQAKLNLAIKQQHNYYNNLDPFNVEINNPFAVNFTLDNYTPEHSMTNDKFENISIELLTDGKPVFIEVDVHLRTASNPSNENYNWGVKILPANSANTSGGFALPAGYNAAIYNNVENRNYSGSAIILINFSSQKDYLNFMRHVSE